MSTFTENYNLIKPQEEDYYDVQDFNENFDTIDSQMAVTEQAVTDVSEKIGASADSGAATVFGKLNQVVQAVEGIRLVKSIQHVKYSASQGDSGGKCRLKSVDPSRCFVIMERLHDTESSGLTYFSYTLNATEIEVSHVKFTSIPGFTIGFWVIEFY